MNFFNGEKSCRRCVYSEPYPIPSNEGRQLVACHFNPPQVVVVADGFRSQFPVLEPEMKCGQFKPK